MGWLVLNHDGTDLVVHKLLGEVMTIGRVPLNHVVIDNPTVSAQHDQKTVQDRMGES
jgi:pSer/pThr/pTyr-binding forkhead associated (FHA) protein